jgi:D-threonate/D-erythronate kinase
MTAVADDLTGAAEIAAAGHRAGLESAVVTAGTPPAGTAALVVYDTDSRLLPAGAAARIVRETTGRALARSALLYKKVDSVLRGHVAIEVEACADAAGRSRVLLVPANPGLGRTIRGGTYFVGEVPLDQSVFAHDPHHPARSGRVTDLLGTAGRRSVQVIPVGAELPAGGFAVGEAATPDDLAHWARRVDATTLPAGGGEFFSAWLRQLGHERGPGAAAPPWLRPLLVVSGTTVPASRQLIHRLFAAGLPVIGLPDSIVHPDAPDLVAARRWADEIAEALATRGVAITPAPSRIASEPAAVEAVRTAFSRMAAHLFGRRAFAHLVIEGGATAAAIVRALGWDQLTVVAEAGPGVVTLRPAAAPDCLLTLKPGSYPWPDLWWRHLHADFPARR